jgi:CRISPR-associated protein Csc2
MSEEFIVHTDFIGEDFQALLKEVKTLTASEAGIQSILKQANDEAKAYAEKYIGKKKTASARS